MKDEEIEQFLETFDQTGEWLIKEANSLLIDLDGDLTEQKLDKCNEIIGRIEQWKKDFGKLME